MGKQTLVIRFGSIGDLVLASAPVLNLKLNDPSGRVLLFTKERWKSIAEMLAGVDSTVTLSEEGGLGSLRAGLRELNQAEFDRIVDLHGNLRSRVSRRMIGAPEKVQYPKRRKQRKSAVRRQNKIIPDDYPHTIDSYNQALKDMGVPTPTRRPIINAPALDEERAHAVSGDKTTVLIAPGAAHPTKAWPLERFAELAARLQRERGCRIIWAVSDQDRDRQTAALAILPRETVHLVGCPLNQLAGVIARCRLVVANDSGIAHIGSAVGTPVIALFGPTHPVLGFAPRGLRDRVVQVDEFCRPCSLHGQKPCYRDNRYCFTRIEVDHVYAEAVDLLDTVDRLRPALFVDRDGTLMVNKHYLADPDGVELITGAAGSLVKAQAAGYKVVIVSNQSGVARGIHSLDSVEVVNRRLTELLTAEGMTPDGIYFCPHHPTEAQDDKYAVDCNCRKPSPGMVEQAAMELDISLKNSFVIGDSRADVGLGLVSGARPILVRTGYGRDMESENRTFLESLRVRVVDDLSNAIDLVLANSVL